jgi:signal transduction histidine kinase/CheY-like chemotaxis protein/HPt (histidine-containing phosphotransfer) domain-containing protein
MAPFIEWFHTRRSLIVQVDQLNEALRLSRAERDQAVIEAAAVRKLADASVTAKNTYLANLSHDLRTPINAILGFSSLARRMELPLKIQHYIKRISKAAEDIRDIINDVLDLSKIEADMMKVDPIEFHLEDVLAKVVNVTALMAAEKDLEFVVTGLETLEDHRWGDPLRLGQVLTNLATNAIKFTPSGHVAVRVAADPGRPDSVRFEVEDTGIGIGPDQQAEVFQAFHQGDGGTARKFGGTGLGLAISRKLVELMGGHLDLRSKLGAGTTFSFALDLPPRPERTSRPRLRTGARAMVVGAPALTQAALKGLLEAHGVQALCVASGAEALAALRPKPSEPPFDLVFLSQRMPELDGLETARTIRQNPWLKGLPIMLLVSSAADDALESQAERDGIKVLLTLPALPGPMGEAMVRAAQGPALDTQSTGRIWFGSPAILRELSGARVLLVDDNAINLELGTDLLAIAGIEVVAVPGGREAIARMDEARFDAILMDLEMPGMDGWETTAQIRARPADGNTPVIALTAHALTGFRDQCLAAGMNDYVAKPFELAQLFRVLSQWIPARTPVPPPMADARFHGLEQVIAIHDALERMEGNADLLEKYLKKLYLAPVHAEDEVRAALDRGDLAAARDIVHPIRGLVGMLGMTQVFKAAEALETSLKAQDREASEAAQAQFAEGLRRFRTSMEALYPRA